MARTIFVHLSDIHFSKPGGAYDLDQQLRNEIENDLRSMRAELGAIEGILITGDIAFSGKKEEFEKARDWLTSISDIIECRRENIWTVPGNHDVDRNKVQQSKAAKNFRANMRRCGTDEMESLDKEIEETMRDRSMSLAMYEPLEGYNEFAAVHQCDMNPSNPCWESDIQLNDGSTLRLRGLNSALISDSSDNDTNARLALGTAQVNFKRESGVEYLALCHHPVDWLIDREASDQKLSVSSRIQLFGHKHKQTHRKINETLRLVAGAVHPERGKDWVPRYNFIALQIFGTGNDRKMKVELYPRVWKSDAQSFVADLGLSNGNCQVYELSLPLWGPPAQVVALPPLDHVGSDSEPLKNEEFVLRRENRINTYRRLTYRFLTLPFHQQVEVAQSMELFLDKDKGVSDNEFFMRIYNRAKDGRRLKELWDSIELAHGIRSAIDNPFIRTTGSEE